jgi:hypothetical protein
VLPWALFRNISKTQTSIWEGKYSARLITLFHDAILEKNGFLRLDRPTRTAMRTGAADEDCGVTRVDRAKRAQAIVIKLVGQFRYYNL